MCPGNVTLIGFDLIRVSFSNNMAMNSIIKVLRRSRLFLYSVLYQLHVFPRET